MSHPYARVRNKELQYMVYVMAIKRLKSFSLKFVFVPDKRFSDGIENSIRDCLTTP